jgi:hypothetical protein
MDQISNESDWSRRLEECLAKACEAESCGDQAQADHFFRMALLCEERMHSTTTVEQPLELGVS